MTAGAVLGSWTASRSDFFRMCILPALGSDLPCVSQSYLDVLKPMILIASSSFMKFLTPEGFILRTFYISSYVW